MQGDIILHVYHEWQSHGVQRFIQAVLLIFNFERRLSFQIGLWWRWGHNRLVDGGALVESSGGKAPEKT